MQTSEREREKTCKGLQFILNSWCKDAQSWSPEGSHVLSRGEGRTRERNLSKGMEKGIPFAKSWIFVVDMVILRCLMCILHVIPALSAIWTAFHARRTLDSID